VSPKGRYPLLVLCNRTAFVPIECRGAVVGVAPDQGRIAREEEAVGDEGIVLTDREREALAELAESIGDPWLARQLAGQEPLPPPRPRGPRLAGVAAALQRATAGWVGLLLLLGGAALTVMMFVHSTLVASLGLAMMGLGAWRLVIDHADAITRRWTTARRARPTEPQPPRKPPGAA
jgi:hypothetical protein